ncbi:hypothetical protein FHS77_000500 [Paenochrobactrum gallinarii]|uniref:Uncharacterized protein n=1 Tax=Paenochrobactrum gallinarii TaxID=643673 RepID=A0A841LTW0_9HYPH|nr:hypothetical protein [Paenochrobactrum gallinarii]
MIDSKGGILYKPQHIREHFTSGQKPEGCRYTNSLLFKIQNQEGPHTAVLNK